jgi:hypothetical protein
MHVLNILERDGGNEARRLPRVGALSVELVDLLEGEALGLVDHGPDEEDADETASAPDEEDLGAHVGVAGAVVDHVGGSVADGEVEKPAVDVSISFICGLCSRDLPVGCGGHGQRLRADLEREDFTSDDPGDGSPGAGEEEDVDADECDQSLLGSQILNASNGTGDSDDELADRHTDSTKEQKVAATPLLNEVKTGEGRGNVDT